MREMTMVSGLGPKVPGPQRKEQILTVFLLAHLAHAPRITATTPPPKTEKRL